MLNASGAGGVQLGLIITPMLDMAFQILSFFIMTYHPSALEGHIPGSLVPPENHARQANENVVTEQTPASVTPDLLIDDLNQAIQVKIKAVPKGGSDRNRAQGQPTQIMIKQALGAGYETIADVDNTVEQSITVLEAHLKTMGGADKTHIRIEGDGDLHQLYVMMAYDACKKAGFSKIHFVPPPMLRERR